MDDPDYRERAYDDTMVRLGRAFKDGNTDLVEKLNRAINAMEDIWPEEVARSLARHGVPYKSSGMPK